MTGRAYQARLPGNALRSESILFTQTSGNGTYTGQIVVPAGACLRRFSIEGLADFDSTSAILTIGDEGDPDGFFTATDFVGLALSVFAVNIPGDGGQFLASSYGAYIGYAVGAVLLSPFSVAARTITATLMQVGTGTAGRLRITFAWDFAETNAVKA